MREKGEAPAMPLVPADGGVGGGPERDDGAAAFAGRVPVPVWKGPVHPVVARLDAADDLADEPQKGIVDGAHVAVEEPKLAPLGPMANIVDKCGRQGLLLPIRFTLISQLPIYNAHQHSGCMKNAYAMNKARMRGSWINKIRKSELFNAAASVEKAVYL